MEQSLAAMLELGKGLHLGSLKDGHYQQALQSPPWGQIMLQKLETELGVSAVHYKEELHISLKNRKVKY